MCMLACYFVVWRNIRSKVHSIVEQLKNKIAPAAISNIEAAEKVAELDFTSAIEEMSKDQPIVKRSVTDGKYSFTKN